MPKAYGFTEYGGPETQEFLDRPRPGPGPAELLVAVRAAGVNPVDWKIRAGYLREDLPLALPAVLGREVAGVVAEVGGDVDGFAVGDEVLGTTAADSGGFAEFAVLTAGAAIRKPTGVSFADAAVLPVAGCTAYDGIRQLALEPGHTLLINGIGGGIGVTAAQLARDVGITVIGTAAPDKKELVESLGAMAVPYGEGVADRIREILPNGVDAILDLVGGDALRAVAGLVSDGSRLVSTGDPQTAAEFGGAGVERDHTGSTLAAVARLVADGKLDPHVTDVVPFERAGSALAAVESGHARGKVVVQLS